MGSFHYSRLHARGQLQVRQSFWGPDGGGCMMKGEGVYLVYLIMRVFCGGPMSRYQGPELPPQLRCPLGVLVAGKSLPEQPPGPAQLSGSFRGAPVRCWCVASVPRALWACSQQLAEGSCLPLRSETIPPFFQWDWLVPDTWYQMFSDC